MSEREELQNDLASFISNLEWPNGSNIYNAPYGVIANLTKLENSPGYVRTITFGCARTLDAYMLIFSKKKIIIEASGKLAPRIEGEYSSPEDVKAALELKD